MIPRGEGSNFLFIFLWLGADSLYYLTVLLQILSPIFLFSSIVVDEDDSV